MKKKDSVLSKDLHLIRVAGEENNARTREAWKNKYKRINRKKRSKFWVWWYYWMDKMARKKEKKLREKIMRNVERGESLEEELEIMERNNQCISNGKIAG